MICFGFASNGRCHPCFSLKAILTVLSRFVEINIFSAKMGASSSKEDNSVADNDQINASKVNVKHSLQKTPEELEDRFAGFKFKPLSHGEQPSFDFKTLPSNANTSSSNISTNKDLQGFRFKSLESSEKPVQQQAKNLTLGKLKTHASKTKNVDLSGFRFKATDNPVAQQNKPKEERLTNIYKNSPAQEKSHSVDLISNQLESLKLDSNSKTPKRVIAVARRSIPNTANITVQTRDSVKKKNQYLQTYADIYYTSDESENDDTCYNYLTSDDDDDSLHNLTSNSSNDSLFDLTTAAAKAIAQQDYTPILIKSKPKTDKASKKSNAPTKSNEKSKAKFTPEKKSSNDDSSMQKR